MVHQLQQLQQWSPSTTAPLLRTAVSAWHTMQCMQWYKRHHESERYQLCRVSTGHLHTSFTSAIAATSHCTKAWVALQPQAHACCVHGHLCRLSPHGPPPPPRTSRSTNVSTAVVSAAIDPHTRAASSPVACTSGWLQPRRRIHWIRAV